MAGQAKTAGLNDDNDDDDDSNRLVTPGTTASTTSSIVSGSLATMLQSDGPIVKCVLLKHIRSSGRDVYPHPHIPAAAAVTADVLPLKDDDKKDANGKDGVDTDTKPAASTNETTTGQQHREVLTELIEEITVDTTPGSNGVEKALGCSTFTFLGQYPDEGIVLMVRADQFHDISDIDTLSIRELKGIVQDNQEYMDQNNINIKTLIDKNEYIDIVKSLQLPINPHILQPPFHECTIRGDILLMRVASPNDEEDDDDDDDDDEVNDDKDEKDELKEDNTASTSAASAAAATSTSIDEKIQKAINEITSTMAVPNDDFFLDYTKDEYIKFASRTDIIATDGEFYDDDDDDEEEEGDDDEEAVDGQGDDVDDDEDEEYNNNEGDDDEEEAIIYNEEDDKRVLLNLILGEVIKSFRIDNGRGPDSTELLELRYQVAAKLQLPIPPPASQLTNDSNNNNEGETSNSGNKRTINHDTSTLSPSPKKVKFTPEILEKLEHEQKEDGEENKLNVLLSNNIDSNYNNDNSNATTDMNPTLKDPDR